MHPTFQIDFLINQSRESLHMRVGAGRNQKSLTLKFLVPVYGIGSLPTGGKLWKIRVRSVFLLDI
jgi:hypothetical protein